MKKPNFLETPPQMSRLALPLILALATFFASLPPTPLAGQQRAALWVYVYRASSDSFDPFRVVANPATDWDAYGLTINITYGRDAETSGHTNDVPIYSDEGPVETASLTWHDRRKPQLSAITAVRVPGYRCVLAQEQRDGRATYACNRR